METKKEKKEEIIVEPVLDASAFGMMDPAISEEAAAPLGVSAPEVGAGAFGIQAAPTTNHFAELSDEMIYNNYRALSLLYKMFKYTFYYGTRVNTQFVVSGVWEVGETGTYSVTVRNSCYFDLASLRVYLSVINGTGSAEITGPSSQLIGDLAHKSKDTVSFTVKAKRAGIIEFAVTVNSFIGSCKQKFSHNGRYWNGRAWGYKSDYRLQYSIY